MKYIFYIIVALILSSGLAGMGKFIKDGLIKIQSADRYVDVKGLAERDVKSDLAIWPIPFRVADNSLDIAKAELERQKIVIEKFLKDNGIKSEEISIDTMMISDANAQQYQSQGVLARYAIDMTYLVRTTNVDLIATASQKVGDLIAEGVLIGYGSIPQYSYTNLNSIKPEMIAAATLNAREAAQQFAEDSGATVGDIRSATQGYFSISARDTISNSPDSASLYKKVRVVSTVQYYLND